MRHKCKGKIRVSGTNKLRGCPAYPRKGRVYCSRHRVNRKLRKVRRHRAGSKMALVPSSRKKVLKSDVKKIVLESPILMKLGKKLFKKLGHSYK